MPVLSRRARLVALATLLALAAGLLLVATIRPRPAVGLDPPPSISTPPQAAEILLAVGDIGSCDGQADEAVAALASGLPGSIALLGDIAYDQGSAADFENCFEPAWGPMRSRLHPVPGNHDYETPGASAYFDWFGAAAGTLGQGWYSFELGAWHLVALNSNCGAVGGCGPGSAELAWLEADLAAHPSACLLAFWHHPRYSSGLHGTIVLTDSLWDALVAHGLDVALAGHDHSYERLAVDGAREFVVGTGGRSIYEFEHDPLPMTEVRHAGSYGLLWLALGANAYEWQFLSLGDPTFTDTGSGDCA
jgi:alkaline phosphatase